MSLHFICSVVVLSLGWLFCPQSSWALSDLRLRLADASQVQRTTSVDWWDLSKQTKRKTKSGDVSASPSLKSVRVLIDAGHGGHDLGAVGWFDILEKDLVRQISSDVKRDLLRQSKKKNISLDVRLSRSDDTFIPLRERVRIANDWDADLFVSVHANSSEFRRAQGFEVYFLNSEATDEEAGRVAIAENRVTAEKNSSPIESILSDIQTNLHVNQSSRFAEVVYQQMAKSLRSNGRGVRQAPFAVLEGTQMPALLVEVGYVTHPGEARKLTERSYLKRVARAISDGIVEFALQWKKVS